MPTQAIHPSRRNRRIWGNVHPRVMPALLMAAILGAQPAAADAFNDPYPGHDAHMRQEQQKAVDALMHGHGEDYYVSSYGNDPIVSGAEGDKLIGTIFSQGLFIDDLEKIPLPHAARWSTDFHDFPFDPRARIPGHFIAPLHLSEWKLLDFRGQVSVGDGYFRILFIISDLPVTQLFQYLDTILQQPQNGYRHWSAPHIEGVIDDNCKLDEDGTIGCIYANRKPSQIGSSGVIVDINPLFGTADSPEAQSALRRLATMSASDFTREAKARAYLLHTNVPVKNLTVAYIAQMNSLKLGKDTEEATRERLLRKQMEGRSAAKPGGGHQ